MAWYIVLGLFAVLLLDVRTGAAWTSASAATVLAFFVAQQLGFQCPNELSPGQTAALHCVGLLGAVFTAYGFVFLLLQPHQDAVRNVEALNDQLVSIEQELDYAKRAREFSMTEWIQLDERRGTSSNWCGKPNERSASGASVLTPANGPSCRVTCAGSAFRSA